ncbi:Pancreatic lipase- protein 2 [Bulinus truncatus]|nr:Pancreatic lipase- protein 2 [Bulinus truncatus]
MFLHIAVLLTAGLVVVVSAQGAQFLDCPGNQVNNRRCCTSDQLPKGCECYETSSSSAYTNTPRQPQCPADINVSFNLYTRANRNTAQKIRSGSANIKSTRFNGAKKTVFIAHGFTDNGLNAWCIAMKNALLDSEDLNVVLVDWREGAKGPPTPTRYNQAIANTRTVGSMIGRLIQDMNSFTNARIELFHLVGHSLGAHVMGFAGQEVFRLTSRKVGRITGLDPAGPAHNNQHQFVRLDSTDGLFVDVIHTDAGFMGITNSIGHVDFYPNGGKHQPRCPNGVFLIFQLNCSHVRVLDYFTNSISRCRYNPPNGNAACTMGYRVSTSCRGNQYPVTKNRAPFC